MPTNNTKAQVPATAANSQNALAFVEYKNKITTSVLNKIDALRKGGITVPAGYSADNQIYLAFLKLTAMTAKSPEGRDVPMLSTVKPQSVANAMLTMCIKGLSLDKGQCTFIKYGDELQFQQEYHGTIALAKRYGAGDPQAQVIYEGDEFEYEIDVHTGKKRVTKHVQKFENIDKEKIVGAWCIVPYANHPELDPKVEVMTMAEIRQSWMQGATKGQSPAHRNFPGEMCKKTVIGRACKLFISTSDDAGVYEQSDGAEWQEQKEDSKPQEAVFEGLPQQISEEAAVKAQTEAVEAPEAPAEPSEPVDASDIIDDGFFKA